MFRCLILISFSFCVASAGFAQEDPIAKLRKFAKDRASAAQSGSGIDNLRRFADRQDEKTVTPDRGPAEAFRGHLIGRDFEAMGALFRQVDKAVLDGTAHPQTLRWMFEVFETTRPDLQEAIWDWERAAKQGHRADLYASLALATS